MQEHCQQAEGGEPSSQLSTVKATFGLEGPSLHFQVQERYAHTSGSPAKGRKMVEGLNHLSYQQRLRGLVLFRLEKRMLKGRKSSMCIYVRRRETKNEEARMFIIEASDRTRSNEHILKTKPIKQQQKETKQNTKTNTLQIGRAHV